MLGKCCPSLPVQTEILIIWGGLLGPESNHNPWEIRHTALPYLQSWSGDLCSVLERLGSSRSGTGSLSFSCCPGDPNYSGSSLLAKPRHPLVVGFFTPESCFSQVPSCLFSHDSLPPKLINVFSENKIPLGMFVIFFAKCCFFHIGCLISCNSWRALGGRG
jgi:hypothetical protein